MRPCPICNTDSTLWTIGVEDPGDGRPFLRLTEGVDCPECGRIRVLTWRGRTHYWPMCPTCRHDQGVTVTRYREGGGFIPEAWVCWDCGTRYQRREGGRGGLEIMWRPPGSPPLAGVLRCARGRDGRRCGVTSIYSVFPPPEPPSLPEEEWDDEPTMAEILVEFDDGGDA